MEMSQIFQGTFFELRFPDNWETEIIENIPCFFDPLGGGVVQIVATRGIADTSDLKPEMSKYLARHGLEYHEDKIVRYQTPSGLRAMACEFIREERFWLVQMLSEADKLIVFLFNSDEVPEQELAMNISQMVQSIKIA